MALTDGLISYWKFEEALAPFADSVGNNPFTAPGSPPSRIPGKLGKGLQFSGDPQHLAINDNTSLATGNTDFFMAIWVYLDSKAADMAIISKTFGTVGASDEYLLEYHVGSDRFRFNVSDGSAVTTVSANNFGSPSTATWYLVMAWHDSVNDQIAIQVNNGSANTAAHSTGVNDTSTRLIIGFTEGGGPNYVFLGRLDEMGLWNRILSTDERSQLYNSGNGRTLPEFEFLVDPDVTLSNGLICHWKLEEPTGSVRYDFMGNRHLTDNNTVERIEGKRGHAAHFAVVNNEFLSGPGVSDAYLSPGDIDFTIGCWVYLDSKTVRRTIIKKGDWNALSGLEYNLCYDPTPDRFRLRVSGDGTTFSTIDANSLGSPSTGTWYYILVWHDSVSNTINIQVNGGTVDNAPHTTGIFRGAGFFNVGSADNSGSDQMAGRIDEVSIWNRVLSGTERSTLYNSGNGNTPKINLLTLSASLVSHWTLNEYSGQRDDSFGTNDLTETGGTTGAALGKVAVAASFTATTGRWLGHADNTDLSTGDIDFTFAVWVNSNSFGDRTIFWKSDNGTNNREYQLRLSAFGGNNARFTISTNGGGGIGEIFEAVSTEASATGIWYFIVAWHDKVHNEICVQVNNGTIFRTAVSGGVFDGNSEFRVGHAENPPISFNPFDGSIDNLSFWKRKLTHIEKAVMFNSGYGRTLPPLRITVDAGEHN